MFSFTLCLVDSVNFFLGLHERVHLFRLCPKRGVDAGDRFNSLVLILLQVGINRGLDAGLENVRVGKGETGSVRQRALCTDKDLVRRVIR